MRTIDEVIQMLEAIKANIPARGQIPVAIDVSDYGLGYGDTCHIHRIWWWDESCNNSYPLGIVVLDSGEKVER